MEVFAKPAAGGIIIKRESGIDYILIQERCKENGGAENGLIEIPAGKIREFENIFDCLRREILEETGLKVIKLNRAVCLQSYFKRVITNIGKVRPDMPEGCPEKFDFEFMKYIWNFPKKSGQANINRLRKSKGKQIIVFTNRREAKQLIIELSNNSNL